MTSVDQLNNPFFLEENRINSFFGTNWGPLTQVFYDLARDGLYRIEGSANYKCVFCGFIYYRSAMPELYWVKHRLNEPACAFIHPHHPQHQSCTEKNIPIANRPNLDMENSTEINTANDDENEDDVSTTNEREDEVADSDPGEDVVGMLPLNPEIEIDFPFPIIDQVRHNRRFLIQPRKGPQRSSLIHFGEYFF